MSASCPKCGYPDTKDGQNFKGLYDSKLACPHCKYFEGTFIEDTFDTLLEQHISTEEGRRKVAEYAASYLKDHIKQFRFHLATERALWHIVKLLQAISKGQGL